MHNFEREDLALKLDLHLDTLEAWELHNVMPKPENIIKLCNLFNIELNYFHEYYTIYFDDPGHKIKSWKENNNITYKQASEILDITHSGLGRLLNGRIKLSYYMYKKCKEQKIF